MVFSHLLGDGARVEFEARDLLFGPGVGVRFALLDFLVEALDVLIDQLEQHLPALRALGEDVKLGPPRGDGLAKQAVRQPPDVALDVVEGG